jgi:hypothetical protein
VTGKNEQFSEDLSHYDIVRAMERGRVSDEAVKKQTGKTWDQWFVILNKAGCREMDHTEIAHFLSTEYIKNGWWAQMVTVEYERASGARKINENKDGFLVAVHKTVGIPVRQLQREWQKIVRSKALAPRNLVQIPSKTKRPMLRYKADVGSVVVFFDERGDNRSRIMVESVKLPSQKTVEERRAYWKKVLSTLDVRR